MTVAVAISAFRSDDAVIGLLEAIFSDPNPEVDLVIVVDSLGSGIIDENIAKRGWPVIYENAEHNLGSASNLARRIRLATESGADWCYCLNHDAYWRSDNLTEMLAVARSGNKTGAVYPVLHHGKRKLPWENGRRNFSPSSNKRLAEIPEGEDSAEVLWSSSNGALYATAPAQEGILVMDSLWMGYEDLAYGIALAQGGWRQLVCHKAILMFGFDYGCRGLFGRAIYIPEKPIWYSYYNIRNLLLIRKKYGAKGVTGTAILRKLIQSTARILLLEDQKVARLTMLYRGAVAGLRGTVGKGAQP